MKLLRRMSLILVSACIMLSVVCFASATSASKENLKTFLKQLPLGNSDSYNSSNMPYLEQYPKVVEALSQVFLEAKADKADFDTDSKDSLANKLYSYRINKNILESNSRYKNMLIFLGYVSVITDHKFVSKHTYVKGEFLYGPLHFCCMPLVTDSNGNKTFYFQWVDKEQCKETVKKMMDGTFDIKENIFWKDRFKNDDSDLLFFKYTQDAIIKYFGDIDSFFNDETFSTKFFKTMFEVITDKGESPASDQRMISIISNDKSEQVKDYKRLGHIIIKKTLEYRWHEELKDYEIEYDETTGYIKSIKKLSDKDFKYGTEGITAQFVNNVLILACVFFVLVVIAVVVILVVVLVNKNK